MVERGSPASRRTPAVLAPGPPLARRTEGVREVTASGKRSGKPVPRTSCRRLSASRRDRQASRTWARNTAASGRSASTTAWASGKSALRV